MFKRNILILILIVFLTLCLFLEISIVVVFSQVPSESTKTLTVTLKEKKNFPIPTFQANDFQITQDGKPLTILSVKASNETPINLAIVIQEGSSDVNLELETLKHFVSNLPFGSKVMLAYTKDGFIDLRQVFTSDLHRATSKIRLVDPFSNQSANPYLDLKAFLNYFNPVEGERNQILFISDGFDPFTRTFSPASNNLYLTEVVRRAQKKNIPIFSIFAPSPRVKDFFACTSAQNSLTYLSEQTGGEALYINSLYVSFDNPLEQFSQLLNQQYVLSYVIPGKDTKYHQVKITTDFSNIEVLAAKEFRLEPTSK